MEYSKIVSVSGLVGLFEMVSSKQDGGIIRNLDGGTTLFASSRIHQFSQLENIEIYTVNGTVKLSEIFAQMEPHADNLPVVSSSSDLKAFFEKVYPGLDFTRVYNSDLKKMVKWFSILRKNEINYRKESNEDVVPEIENNAE